MLGNRRSVRILILLLIALAGTSLLSPWIWALWNSVGSGLEDAYSSASFSEIFSRLFMILSISLILFFRRMLGIESLSELGLQPLQRAYRNLLLGFLLTLLSVFALAGVMSLSGIFTPYLRLTLGASLERIASAFLSAVAAGLLEEIFFRGLIFKALLEDSRPAIAFVISSFFYSAIHFVKPIHKMALSGADPWAGLRHLGYSFMPFLDPLTLFPGLFGLFLIGMVLAYAFFRTGSLYLSVGLHAGWIVGLKTLRVYGNYRREDLGWLFGSAEPKLVSGVAAWIGILSVGLLVHLLTSKKRFPLRADPITR